MMTKKKHVSLYIPESVYIRLLEMKESTSLNSLITELLTESLELHERPLVRKLYEQPR